MSRRRCRQMRAREGAVDGRGRPGGTGPAPEATERYVREVIATIPRVE